MPDQEFIVYPDRDLRFTYSSFNERVNNLAKGFIEIGLKKGDHIGIWAKNVPDWLTFQFAAARIGCVLVTINTAYKLSEAEYIIKQSDMKAIGISDGFRDTSYIDIMYELVPELRERDRKNLVSEKFPHLEKVIFIGQEKYRGMYNTREILLLGQYTDDSKLDVVKKQVTPDDVVNMQYTSGTTGFPKGVMLTHKGILNNGFAIGERQSFTEKDRVCLPVPLFHCFGVTLGMMAILSHGSTAVLLEEFDPLLAMAAIQKEKCTAFYGVPTMYISIYTHPMFEMFDMSTLRTGIMAGSTCPEECMRRAIEDMNMSEITSVYGLTETSPGMSQTSAKDSFEKKITTVGVALPGMEVCIKDPETGEIVEQGEMGEICCRGYNVMKGYYNMPEETAKVIDEDGFLHSGDLAFQDEDGYYIISGRIKDMIIRGGENIYPREIEEFIYRIPGVKDVQVVGLPDEKYGEIVGAFIIPEDDVTLYKEDIRDCCIKNMARYKVPKQIFFLDEYPLTVSGKVQKYKLRDIGVEMLKEELKEEEK
ncbi:MAG: AMP-binding protein [Methanosarcinaceae archaeon]|nr:AMP-binding protein [Methanosarcinaceae archaeon]